MSAKLSPKPGEDHATFLERALPSEVGRLQRWRYFHRFMSVALAAVMLGVPAAAARGLLDSRDWWGELLLWGVAVATALASVYRPSALSLARRQDSVAVAHLQVSFKEGLRDAPDRSAFAEQFYREKYLGLYEARSWSLGDRLLFQHFENARWVRVDRPQGSRGKAEQLAPRAPESSDDEE